MQVYKQGQQSKFKVSFVANGGSKADSGRGTSNVTRKSIEVNEEDIKLQPKIIISEEAQQIIQK